MKNQVSEIGNTFGTFIYVKQSFSRKPEKFKWSPLNSNNYRFCPSICPNGAGKTRKWGITSFDVRQRCFNCNGIGARKRIYRNGGNWKNWKFGYVLYVTKVNIYKSCGKLSLLVYTMRRNLLNWCNLVSIGKKLRFYVFGVLRVY